MLYFFLAYAAIAIIVVGTLGFRGDKFAEPPIEVFPDMDHQDKVKAQTREDFFADAKSGRKPVFGTTPLGVEGAEEIKFGGQSGYFSTGAMGQHYGSGMPEELELTEESIPGFLKRGQERFNIYCMPCHGSSGNGGGIAAQFGVPGVANLLTEPFFLQTYPDGRLYDVITNGKGQMAGYGYNITLRDRWAITAYVRALQLASRAPVNDPAIKEAYEAATASVPE